GKFRPSDAPKDAVEPSLPQQILQPKDSALLRMQRQQEWQIDRAELLHLCQGLRECLVHRAVAERIGVEANGHAEGFLKPQGKFGVPATVTSHAFILPTKCLEEPRRQREVARR